MNTLTAYMNVRGLKRILSWHSIYTRTNQVVLDALVIALALNVAYWVRFEGMIPDIEFTQLWLVLPYIIILRLFANYLLGVYSIVWRYVRIEDTFVLLKSIGLCSMLFLLARLFLPEGYVFTYMKLPLSVIVIEFLLLVVGMIGIRGIRRVLYERLEIYPREVLPKKEVLLVGAGEAGVLAAREIRRSKEIDFEIKGFIDDDPEKVGSVIVGTKVLGTTLELARFARELKIGEIIITIAAISPKQLRRIVALCEEIEVKVKVIPGLYELLVGQVSISRFREVKIEDLLARSVVELDNNTPEVLHRFAGRRILVTGAGGSIGSELCRQLLPLNPSELLMLDKDENSIFETDLEMRQRTANGGLIPAIVNVRNLEQMHHIFRKHRPEVVFHAAAHKHVPLMEVNPAEAILNNVIGTKNLVNLSCQYDVETFVMISTDKAVNPTNIMGASKRLAEMIVQEKARSSQTCYSCVRFGNVLGSRGSVVPLFQKQIADGGPVTVTHPDATRYFMTIPEAVCLIIQAGSLGREGEIFVLDMGEPVKVLDLAKDMIRLSGLRVDEDIKIEFIGLRPGEKLYEELLIDEEGTKATKHEKILIAPPTVVNARNFGPMLDRLQEIAIQDDRTSIYEILEKWFNGHENGASANGRKITFSTTGNAGFGIKTEALSHN